MGQINVGIIGCGRIADLHYCGYRDRADARVYAVCDSDAATAERRQREWRAVKAYRDYRELINDRDIDAVEILTPHGLHEEMAIAALTAGKHVALQKPMTVSLASADRILAARARAGRVFKVTENYLFYPPIARAKEMIEAGQIGEPLTLRIKFVSGSSGGWEVPASSWQWRMEEVLAGRGTATFDHGHHLWSTAWYLLGAVERVSGWIDFSQAVVDCPALIVWQYRDGRRYGSCDLTHADNLHIPSHYYANDEWIEITGTRGIIFIRRCTGAIHDGPPLCLFDGRAMQPIEIESDWGAGFKGAIGNFIDAINGRAAPALSGAEAREVLRFALAIQKSARIGREVYLDELDSAVPALYAWRRRAARRLRNFKLPALPFLSGEDLSQYAPQAVAVTEQLVRDFQPADADGWDIAIGIHLTPEGNVREERLGLIIRGGKAELQQGRLPEDAKLTVRVPAGVWAAILMRKKRAEVAFLQGKIKVEGQVEEGLKLRAIFKL